MTAPAPTWFGQPRGLTVLFLTEMWEKFSFYGMRALLVYYMTRQLMFDQQRASLVYGLYTAFVFLTPILGGLIADRWLGRRRAVILGGSIMALGHFMMAFEGQFYLALAVIALGNGLFLPSLPSQISGLYSADDPRRGSAYNVYYVGINLGAFLAPLVCGTLGEVYGWHWGFGAAGIGMLAGLCIYIAGQKHLPPEPKRTAPVHAEADLAKDELRRRFILLGAVGLAVVVFRAAYEQTGNTLALWIDASVDRSLGVSWTIPSTWFQSLNPLLVFLLSPFVVAYFIRTAREGREASPLRKMALGAVMVAGAYLMLAALSAWTAASGVQIGWLWVLAFFVLLTAGELFILPVGLGLFGRMAPPRMAATLIAAWFLAGFFGNLLAGLAGTTWSQIGPALFFLMMGGIAAVAGGLLRLLDGPMRRLTLAPREASRLPALEP
ncbi:peptide MFS transporter [Phenylobacterium sp.]|uniref:peptide MFS transporter n=1 Tax=Phenylobacterium sp. TaxID=1871053 RepID=UPI0027315F48|nr:peptide MFS transporter [Phenylobacterium sp.]MDP1618057.1 peptide MFS transporter [Phenylobacterium sp.]MDP1987284.1 peptide MFS transporter [Phenylobacterium sp.]